MPLTQSIIAAAGTCLDENTILDFVTGRLTASAISAVEQHLDSCDRCQLLLSGAGLEQRDPEDSGSWPRVGQRIGGRFFLERWLGCGATGLVFAARDEQLGVEVAIKLLRWDPRRGALKEREGMLACLRREILVGRRIAHANVCRVYDFGSSDGYDYITMELVNGRTLAEVMRDGIETPKAAEMLERICSALAAAHQQGVIHRDLKPTNIMVDNDGKVTVMDFGLARDAFAVDGSREGRLVGTPAYWAPEQLRGAPASVATDLYALGIIAFELLSGQVPSRLAERNAMRLVPAPYRRILRKCLSAEMAERPASAVELSRELGRAVRIHQNRHIGAAAVGVFASLCVAAAVFMSACALHGSDGRRVAAPSVVAGLTSDRLDTRQPIASPRERPAAPATEARPFSNPVHAKHLRAPATPAPVDAAAAAAESPRKAYVVPVLD